MKVTLGKSESRTTYLIVEPEASELEPYIEKVYKHTTKRIEIPGFAKGEAPRNILEEYVGREQIIEDAIKELAHAVYPKVIKDHNLEQWIQPMVMVLQNDPPKFEIAVPMEPIVELCDYRNMDIKPESLDVTEEEVNGILEKTRLQLGEHFPVERPVKEGDLIDIDIEGTVSGSSFMDKKRVRAQITPRFAPDIPDLYKKIIGIKKNEENKFKIKLPEYHVNKFLAGKEADITVTVFDIREVKLPALDDKFSRRVAPGVETLEQLKERIRYNMKSEKEQNADTRFKEKAVEMLLANSRLEYPPLMIELQAKLLVDEYNQQLRSSCKDDKEYEEKRKLISDDNIKENCKALATKRVLWSLVLDEVARQEGIDVSDDEITQEIDGMTEGLKEEKQKEARRYLHSYDRQNVKDLIRARKTINKLAAIVKGEAD